MTVRMGYDCAMTSLSGASEATLRRDSGAGTISGETARNLQKIIDKRTDVLYDSNLVNNVFTLQLNIR